MVWHISPIWLDYDFNWRIVSTCTGSETMRCQDVDEERKASDLMQCLKNSAESQPCLNPGSISAPLFGVKPLVLVGSGLNWIQARRVCADSKWEAGGTLGYFKGDDGICNSNNGIHGKLWETVNDVHIFAHFWYCGQHFAIRWWMMQILHDLSTVQVGV